MFEMGFEELFIRFWWLIFPLFGMAMGLRGMVSSDRRARRAMDLIKTYVEQGKEPPAELLDIASGGESWGNNGMGRRGRRRSSAWDLVSYTAAAIGFGIATQYAHNENSRLAFMIVAAVMAVFAIGSFFILFFGPRPEK